MAPFADEGMASTEPAASEPSNAIPPVLKKFRLSILFLLIKIF